MNKKIKYVWSNLTLCFIFQSISARFQPFTDIETMTYSIQELMRDTVMTFDLMTYSIQELMRDTVMANDPLTSKYSRTNDVYIVMTTMCIAPIIKWSEKCSWATLFNSTDKPFIWTFRCHSEYIIYYEQENKICVK
jgi:hypothetical protein